MGLAWALPDFEPLFASPSELLALLASGSVGPAFAPITRLLPWLVVAGVLGVAVTALGVRAPHRLAPQDAAAADTAAAAADVMVASFDRRTGSA